ncbi:TPA: hypothetical protein ROX98_003628 [Bacillus pseudomycoides]|nr:hypothetical protein [Bacillus pseudomycoides]
MIYKRKRFVFQILFVSICLLLAMFISSGALYTQTILKELLKQEWPLTDGWEVSETHKKKEEVIPPEKGKRKQTSNSKKGREALMEQDNSEVEKRTLASLTNSNPFSNQQLFLILSVMTIVIVIIVLYRLRRKIGKSEVEIVKMSSEQKSEKTTIQRIFSPLPPNEIRAAIAQWERTLPQNEHRLPFETIQQWLFRVRKSKDIVSIYEDVRYGNRDVLSEEVEKVKKWTEEN